MNNIQDGTQDRVMPYIVPSDIPCHMAVVENVQERLVLVAERTRWIFPFFQGHKFALWGSTSTVAFTANFSCSSCKVCTTQDQMDAQQGLVHLLSCPCLSRDWRWSRQEELTSSTTAALANFTRDFLLLAEPP